MSLEAAASRVLRRGELRPWPETERPGQPKPPRAAGEPNRGQSELPRRAAVGEPDAATRRHLLLAGQARSIVPMEMASIPLSRRALTSTQPMPALRRRHAGSRFDEGCKRGNPRVQGIRTTPDDQPVLEPGPLDPRYRSRKSISCFSDTSCAPIFSKESRSRRPAAPTCDRRRDVL